VSLYNSSLFRSFSPSFLDKHRFVYIGLSMKDAAMSLPLFKIHEALTKKAGLGCIVRAVCAK